MPTTTIDSLRLSGSASPSEVAEAIEAEALSLARAIADTLSRAVALRRQAYESSGDPADLGGLLREWLVYVIAEIAPRIAATYTWGWVNGSPLLAAGIETNDVDSWTLAAIKRFAGVGQAVARNLEQGGDVEVTPESVSTLTRTELMSAYNNGDHDAAAEALVKPVEHAWMTTSANPRASHAAAHGQIRPWGVPFDIGGVDMLHPHQLGAPADEVANCHCVEVVLYPGDVRPDGSIVPGTPGPLATLETRKRYDREHARMGMGDRVELPHGDWDPGDTSWNHLNPDGTFTAERQRLHDRIINDALRGLPRHADPEMFLMGGGGGAGKTTVLQSGLARAPKGSVTINADDLKMLLPETNQMRAAGDKGWAFAAHDESSYLTKRLIAAAQERGVNITLDAVGGNPAKVAAQVQAAREAGYRRVTSMYVSIDPNEGVRRARARAEADEAGGVTGRWIPDKIVHNAHVEANSAFEQVAPLTDEAIIVDNSGGRDDPPVLVARWDGSTLHVLDEARWAQIQARGAEALMASVRSLVIPRPGVP